MTMVLNPGYTLEPPGKFHNYGCWGPTPGDPALTVLSGTWALVIFKTLQVILEHNESVSSFAKGLVAVQEPIRKAFYNKMYFSPEELTVPN